MELLAWPKATAERLALLEDFIGAAIVCGLEEPIIIKAIEIRKASRLKLPDAIIASTAQTLNLTLLTRNIDDFKNVQGLKLTNPWEL